jgi:excinuclease UvrABC nuclease subunit
MASKSKTAGQHAAELAGMPKTELALLIQQLQDQMHAAAAELQFELAARLRDEVNELKKELRAMEVQEFAAERAELSAQVAARRSVRQKPLSVR